MLLSSGGRVTPEDNILKRPETPGSVDEHLEEEHERVYLDADDLKKY